MLVSRRILIVIAGLIVLIPVALLLAYGCASGHKHGSSCGCGSDTPGGLNIDIKHGSGKIQREDPIPPPVHRARKYDGPGFNVVDAIYKAYPAEGDLIEQDEVKRRIESLVADSGTEALSGLLFWIHIDTDNSAAEISRRRLAYSLAVKYGEAQALDSLRKLLSYRPAPDIVRLQVVAIEALAAAEDIGCVERLIDFLQADKLSGTKNPKAFSLLRRKAHEALNVLTYQYFGEPFNVGAKRPVAGVLLAWQTWFEEEYSRGRDAWKESGQERSIEKLRAYSGVGSDSTGLLNVLEHAGLSGFKETADIIAELLVKHGRTAKNDRKAPSDIVQAAGKALVLLAGPSMAETLRKVAGDDELTGACRGFAFESIGAAGGGSSVTFLQNSLPETVSPVIAAGIIRGLGHTREEEVDKTICRLYEKLPRDAQLEALRIFGAYEGAESGLILEAASTSSDTVVADVARWSIYRRELRKCDEYVEPGE